MRIFKSLSLQIAALIILSCSCFTTQAQDVEKTVTAPERPKFSSSLKNVSVSEIDNVVGQSFNLLKNVDDLSFKVQSIKEQLHSISDPSQLVSQIEECSNALITIGTTTPALAESLADMISNIKDLHVPILKVPAAIKNLNEARKAIQYSIVYTRYLVASVIPGIKKSKQIITDTTGAVITVKQ